MTQPSESPPEPDEVMPSAEEMRNALLLRLYNERDKLNGIALVNGLKAISDIAKQDREQPDKRDEVEPHSLLDQLQSVPPEHAIKLLKAELERLHSEIATHQAALSELEGI